MPAGLKLADFENLVVLMSGSTTKVGIELYSDPNDASAAFAFWWGREVTGSEAEEVTLNYNQLGYSWNETLDETQLNTEIGLIMIKNASEGMTDPAVTIHSITFVAPAN